jgi:ubiquinone/menaquinone biosynthesis C-methylase UbiE
MDFYDRYILPNLIDLACSAKPVLDQRQLVVPLAEGKVLEIGIGSGINLDYYDFTKVEIVFGLEPSEGMRNKVQRKLAGFDNSIELLDTPAEEIPLQSGSIDTVLLTYSLCTIPGWLQALEEMRRVLKPTGKLIFCEHGAAPDVNIFKWQNRMNPLWSKIAGGCNLNRDIPGAIHKCRFEMEWLKTGYLKRTPKTMGFNYWGVSRPIK